MGSESLTIDEKMRSIDNVWKDKIAQERLMPYKTLEERMVQYKRECDERVKREIEAEVNRVRELEIAQVRMTEASNYRKQLNEYQSELDTMHQENIKELKRSE